MRLAFMLAEHRAQNGELPGWPPVDLRSWIYCTPLVANAAMRWLADMWNTHRHFTYREGRFIEDPGTPGEPPTYKYVLEALFDGDLLFKMDSPTNPLGGYSGSLSRQLSNTASTTPQVWATLTGAARFGTSPNNSWPGHLDGFYQVGYMNSSGAWVPGHTIRDDTIETARIECPFDASKRDPFGVTVAGTTYPKMYPNFPQSRAITIPATPSEWVIECRIYDDGLPWHHPGDTSIIPDRAGVAFDLGTFGQAFRAAVVRTIPEPGIVEVYDAYFVRNRANGTFYNMEIPRHPGMAGWHTYRLQRRLEVLSPGTPEQPGDVIELGSNDSLLAFAPIEPDTITDMSEESGKTALRWMAHVEAIVYAHLRS